MKYLSLLTLSLFSLTPPDETVKLSIEPNHSTIGFSVPIAGGITRVTGKFMDFELAMDYVEGDLTRSSVNFTIKAESITTGIEQRDEHLRSGDFFEVATYPEITFVSSSLTKTGESYAIEGDFTMHGTTKRVTIPFTVTHQEGNTVGISIRWSLNRKDYGVGNAFQHTSIKNFIADDIGIEVDFWTRKARARGN